MEHEQVQIVLEKNLCGTAHSVWAVPQGMIKKSYGKIVTVIKIGLQAIPDAS